MIKSSITISLVPQIKNGPWIFGNPLESSIAKAAEIGFSGVELFTLAPDSVKLSVLSTLLDNYQIPISAVGTGAGKIFRGLTLTDPDPGIRKEAILFITEMIRFGSCFNAPSIIGSMQGNVSSQTDREQAIFWLTEGLNILGDAAEELGVKLLFEPLNRYETNLINNLEGGISLINSLDTKNVWLLADLFHMNIEEKSISETISVSGKYIGHVHFADSNRYPVGLGHIQMPEIATALKRINYFGFISAEAIPYPDPEKAARQTIYAFNRFFCS
jgi:sugar phosphate isomerase/epimerase